MDDFKFSVSLLEDFFSQRKIQQSLEIIWDQDITGWETWLQIEFSTFLIVDHANEIEWYREHQILADRRKNKERTKMSADFIFRRKGFKRDSYIVLEFKQNPSLKACFSRMVKDIEKIDCARASSIDMRNFWVVGIHPKSTMTKTEIKDFVSEKADIEKNSVVTRYIPNTNYAFTIF